LHAKHHEWEKIFEFFKTHPVAKATLATKIIPKRFLSYNPERKVRIRFSLMPERIRQILEPNTESTLAKILAINEFIDAGYDVHVNYSPVVYYEGWKRDYTDLFLMMEDHVGAGKGVMAEVIMLTHNVDKHDYNIANNIPGEDLLWRPDIQEVKTSSYGGKNIRYEREFKKRFIKEFKDIHQQIIPWNTIRYIF
jgi:spore photoproduct lyase